MAACPHPPERTEPLLEGRDWVTGEAFGVRRCAGCGLAVTAPGPSGEDLGRYYPAAYYGAAGGRRFPAAVERLQVLLHAGRARRVERLAGGRPGKVLDVGCGPGSLLQAFRRRGWAVQGTELGEAAAGRARAAAIPVQVGPMGGWPWPEGHFDAAVLWHVLEHTPDPDAVLARVARLLRPGGVLLVAVPNFESPEAGWTGSAWFHLDLPRHLVHFSPATLRAQLSAAGLRVRRASFLAPEYDCFSLVQSLENALGLPQNLLYDLLRGRGARLRPGARRLEVAAALLLAAPLAVAALPVTLALGLLGQGATVSLAAVREGQP